MPPEPVFVPPERLLVPPTLLGPEPESELEFADLTPPADADVDAEAEFLDGLVSGLGEALDFLGDLAFGEALALAVAVAALCAQVVLAGAGDVPGELVAARLAPALAGPDAGADWEPPVLGLTGGLLAAVAEAPTGLELAGVEVTTGLLVCGEVLAEAAADGAAEAHGATAAGCRLAAAEPWPLVLLLAAPATAWPGPLCPAVVPPPPPLELCPDSTEELSWTMAWRSGGTAAATPMANTAQATASAGRSMTSRMPQPAHHPARRRDDCDDRDLDDRPLDGPDAPEAPGVPDGPDPPGGPDAPSGTTGTPLSRWLSARPGGGDAEVAMVWPADRILARIRSRPSGRGST